MNGIRIQSIKERMVNIMTDRDMHLELKENGRHLHQKLNMRLAQNVEEQVKTMLHWTGNAMYVMD